ncbi:MAG TPA: hypothetical protein VFC84_16005, partial [Desulfosporosinus sp.]|nr:hypothetical protein [Desulfosporosinus sp.]
GVTCVSGTAIGVTGVVCAVFASVAEVVALTAATPPITRPRDSVVTINVCLIFNIKIILPILKIYLFRPIAWLL